MKPTADTQHEPTIAPGIEMDELDERASSKEIAQGDSTSVTRLELDCTPND